MTIRNLTIENLKSECPSAFRALKRNHKYLNEMFKNGEEEFPPTPLEKLQLWHGPGLFNKNVLSYQMQDPMDTMVNVALTWNPLEKEWE